mgnify:CR=1 FL=1
MEAIGSNALSNLDNYTGGSSGFHSYLAPEPGIVVYNTDGLEQVTADNFTADPHPDTGQWQIWMPNSES